VYLSLFGIIGRVVEVRNLRQYHIAFQTGQPISKVNPSIQQDLLFFTHQNPSGVDSSTNFELELCSRHSVVSMLWLYTYLNMNPQDLPKNSSNISTTEYNRLMTPLRTLFDPIWDCVLHPVEEPSDLELLSEYVLNQTTSLI
jgi:hypothetical protein